MVDKNVVLGFTLCKKQDLNCRFGDNSIQGEERMGDQYDEVKVAAEQLKREIFPYDPKIGFVLGSGLGGWADDLEGPIMVPYDSLPGMVAGLTKGHKSRFVAGKCAGLDVLAMQGRVHGYEGRSMEEIVMGVRTMVMAGCGVVVVTAAAGGSNCRMVPGQIYLVRDHYNSSGINPLVGDNDDRLGPRFPDMTDAYDPELRELAKQVAEGIKVDEDGDGQAVMLKLPVDEYWMNLGPTYETRAEVRVAANLGFGLMGMSMVPEVIAARHMNARVLGLSLCTNPGAGVDPGTPKLDHDEVKAAGGEAKGRFGALLTGFTQALGKQEGWIE